MLLVSALALSAFGLLVWVAGLQMSFKGIGAVGAALVVGVGASVLLDGLQRRAGTIEHAVNSSTTTISVQTEPVTLISSFDAGVVWMLLGSLFLFHALNFEP